MQELKEIGRRLLWIVPIVTLISAAIMTLIHLMFFESPKYGHILASSFIFTAVFSSVMVTAFRQLDVRFSPVNARNIAIHVGVLSILSLLCFFFASWIISGYSETAYLADGTDVLVSFLLTMMITAAVLGVFYVQLFLAREKEARQQTMKAELAALKAQINPHFLFNSLNSIAALTRIDAGKSERVTEDLADLFRYSLNASGRETVTLREELQACELYLAIEQARFGDRLQVMHQVSDELLDVQIPALILQPLVENAIKHGLQQVAGVFTLRIEVSDSREGVILSVTDSGPGMNPGREAYYLSKGTGLSNVRSRLKLQFGSRAKISVLTNGIRITLPDTVQATR